MGMNKFELVGDLTAALTDSSGGVASGTLAAGTNLDTLTITGLVQTPDNSLTEITFNSTWSQGQADTIDKNFKELADQVVSQKALNTVLLNHVASLAAKVNSLINALNAAN